MIARAGSQRISAGIESKMNLNAYPSLKLDQ
jgi:hypothetical protein